MAEQIIFGPVRFAFVNIFTPQAMEEGTPKYNVKCIFEKDKDVKELKRIINAAAKKKFGDDMPKKLNNPIRDGDEVTWNGFADHDFFTASMNPDFGKPGVVDKDANPIMDQGEVYPGCWGYVKISAFGYDTKGNKGVAINLHHLMKTEDDERLDGGESPEQAFADFKPAVKETDNAGTDEEDIFG